MTRFCCTTAKGLPQQCCHKHFPLLLLSSASISLFFLLLFFFSHTIMPPGVLFSALVHKQISAVSKISLFFSRKNNTCKSYVVSNILALSVFLKKGRGYPVKFGCGGGRWKEDVMSEEVPDRTGKRHQGSLAEGALPCRVQRP